MYFCLGVFVAGNLCDTDATLGYLAVFDNQRQSDSSIKEQKTTATNCNPLIRKG